MKICIFDRKPGTLLADLQQLLQEPVVDVCKDLPLLSARQIMRNCSLLLVHETDSGWGEVFEHRPQSCLVVKYTDNYPPNHFQVSKDGKIVECSHSVARRRIPPMVEDAIQKHDQCNPQLLNPKVDPHGALTQVIHEFFLRTLPVRIMHVTRQRFPVRQHFERETAHKISESGKLCHRSLKSFIETIASGSLPDSRAKLSHVIEEAGKGGGHSASFEWPKGGDKKRSLATLKKIVSKGQAGNFVAYCRQFEESLRRLRAALMSAPLLASQTNKAGDSRS